jgi:peroxiredoxin
MIRLAILATVLAVSVPTLAIAPGGPAPDFTLNDATGKPRHLSEFRGRPVVLEWNNPGCPFVQKHYASGNMQRTQARAARDGAVWLTVNSGAPGKQGNMTGAQAAGYVAKEKARPAAYLLDPTGKVGRLYGAKATPDMVVIDKSGMVRFAGGIDDKATADPADIATARNNVVAALADLKAGRPVSVKTARSYGCSVKYAG